MAKAVDLNATLLRRDEITKGLFVIDVKPDAPLFDFEAGQYTTLGLPGSAARLEGTLPEKTPTPPDKIIKRAYSIASAPSRRDALELYINIVDDGVFTPRLFALPIGGRLWMIHRATGNFTLDGVADDHDVVLVSTGTGLAPFMSMLRGPLQCSPTRRVVLIHGVRHHQDLGYREELEAMARRCETFHYLPSVTRPTEAWTGRKGRVQQLFTSGEVEGALGRPIDPQRTHVFLCGNPEMITSMESTLIGQGFAVHKRHAPGRLHIESYW
jgi:ferredoxin/flavodoxin---NADP+ reductase